MQRIPYQLLAVLLVPLLAACGASGDRVAQVTAIPTTDATDAPAATATTTPTATTTIAVETEDTTEEAVIIDEATEAMVAAATEEATATEILATPTPFTAGLQPGESREIAMATDMAMQPTPAERLTFDESPVPITFDEFYDGFDLRRGLMLSDKLVSLDGQMVAIEGYMAPPLKPALDWFVLTRVPLALCPFCSTDADWPSDIALVYMPPDQTVLSTTEPLRVIGRMEVGSSVDAETGMVSIVRVYVEKFERLG